MRGRGRKYFEDFAKKTGLRFVDAKRMLEETGCDGVMFARGAMGNPFIFKKTIQLLQNREYQEIPASERIKTAFNELAMLAADTNEKHACMEMRKRFCAYYSSSQGTDPQKNRGVFVYIV